MGVSEMWAASEARGVGRARFSGIAGALALAALLGASSSASAQEPLEIARQHMEQGQAFYLQGRFDEAAAEFELAHEAQPFSAFLFNAAVAYENGGHLAHAVLLFERYLEVDPDASDEDEVRARIAHLRERIESRMAPPTTAVDTPDATPPDTSPEGSTTSEIPPAESTAPPTALPDDFKSLVNVRTEPAGATVRILGSDGQAVETGSAPVSQTLSAGRYHVTIDHPDYNRAETDIEVEPGHVYMIVMNLSQGEFLGYLRMLSDPPGASVFVDDHDAGARGTTPFEGTARVGTHHVWIERPGYETIERDVEVQVGTDASLAVSLERSYDGRVRVIGNVRGAQIFIDGVEEGAIPWEGEIHAGMHTVRVVAPDMKPWEQGVEIQRGQLTPVRVQLHPSPGRGGAIVSGVFTGIILGGAITMSVLANEWATQLESERAHGTLASDDPRIDQGFAFSVSQYCGYGLAAILLGVTIYYATYDDLPPSEATVLEPRDFTLLPMLDVQTGPGPARVLAGLSLGGSF